MNDPDTKESGVSWLSLLYDLILVAVIGRATTVYLNNPTWETFSFVFLSLLATFVLWALTTLQLLQTHRETWPIRGLVFLQVIALLLGALAMTRGGGLSDQYGFGALAVGFLSIAGLELARIRRNSERVMKGQGLLIATLVSAAMFILGAFFPMGYRLTDDVLIAWITYPLAVLVAVVSSFIVAPPRLAAARSISTQKLNERFGVLLLIVLGDTLLQLLHELGALREIPSVAEFVFALVFIVAVWLLYFPTISEPEFPRSVAMVRVRVSAHFLLVTSTAFSMVPYVSLASEGRDEPHEWTTLPVMGIVVAVGILTLLNDRRWSASAGILGFTFLALVLVGISSQAGFINSVVALYLSLSLLCVDALLIVSFRERKPRL